MADKNIDLTPNELHAKGDIEALSQSNVPETLEALDNLAKEAVKEKPAATAIAPVVAVPAAPAAPAAPAVPVPAAPSVEDEAAKLAAQKKAEEAAAQKKSEDDAAAKIAADAEAARTAATPVTDSLDEIQLPLNTKPKSAEAFGRLKQTAREQIAQVGEALTSAKNEIIRLQQDLATAQAESGKIPEAVEKELAQLRAEHAALDVKNDPEFKRYNSTLTTNDEIICKKLLEGGIVDESAIAKIKELGTDNVDWEKLLAKAPPNVRRFVEATLVDSERVKTEREHALENATNNATEYQKQRQEREQQTVQQSALAVSRKFDWMIMKEVSPTATPEERAAATAHNEEAQRGLTLLNSYLANRSPEMFSELAVGTVVAFKLKSEVAALRSALEVARDPKVVKALTAERDSLKAELDAIKRAQIPRHRGDIVVVGAPAKKADMNTSAVESLDALAKEVIANREE